MNWKQIDRTTRVQPSQGVYGDWKQQIATDCYKQCVYCSIEEGLWGGIDHYHIDHFKPKSRFEDLINVITNLYYSCPICNRFKSDDWPSDANSLDIVCYPDPSDYNYTDLFGFNPDEFSLIPKTTAAKYILLKLYLNRPQLIYERRELILKMKAAALIEETVSLIEKCDDKDLTKEAFSIVAKMLVHLHNRNQISPYELSEIRKQ